jgi:exonuclease SbcD
MRVAVIADSHWDEHSRFEECERLHSAIAADAESRGVDLVLHAGDVFERKSTPLEREKAFAWFQRMANIAPVMVVRGNHDALDDLPLLERLEARHPIGVEQEARVVGLNIRRHDAPAFVDTVAIACVAWPRKAALLAAFGSQSHEDGERSAAEALRMVFRGLGAEMAEHRGSRLLLMHAMVRGSVTSTGQPLVGCDLEVGLEDLALVGADAYLLGHIHKGQQWEIGGAPCVYPGSPRRTSFGEMEAKGYTLLTVEGHQATAEFIELPCTPMVHISAVWEQGQWVAQQLEQPPAGAEVRLRYTVPSDEREAAAAAAGKLRDDLLAAGAVLVKVEPIVITEQRARAPELAKAVTLEEKLAALWAAKGFDPGARRESLLDKVHQLEEVARAS